MTRYLSGNRGALFAILIICYLLAGTVVAVHGQSDVTVNEESGAAYREGLELFQQGKYSEAINKFKNAYQADERNVAALFAQGLSNEKLGNATTAVNLYEKVLAQDPDYEKAVKRYPAALLSAGQSQKAIEQYNKLIEQNPDDFYNYYAKGKALIRLKQYGSAINALNKAAGLKSDEADIWRLLGYAHHENKDLNAALQAYEKASELKPGNTSIMYARAQTLTELGRHSEAYQIASKILERNRNHSRAHVIAGDYFRTNGQYQTAIGHYRSAARNIETKAYAEHYIDVCKQQIEEAEIEREWQQRQQQN